MPEGGEHFDKAEPLLRWSFAASCILCATFTIGGFFLIYTGSTANSTISMFSIKITTGSIGLVCLLFAAVVFVLFIKAAFRAFENILRIPPERRAARGCYEPRASKASFLSIRQTNAMR